MKMEKILACTIAAAMLLSGTAVFAEEDETAQSEEVITEAVENEEALAEEETAEQEEADEENTAEGDIMLINDVAEESKEENGEEEYDKVVLRGEVKEIEDDQIVVGEGETALAFTTDENTLIVDENGEEITKEDIKEGDYIMIAADTKQTKSIPPQSYAYVIAKADGDVLPTYIEVASIEKDDRENTVLSAMDGMYEVILTEEAASAEDLEKIQEGTQLLAYSKLMTMSIPAKIPAEKIIILNAAEEEPEEENKEPEEITDFSKAIVNGTEIEIEIINDEIMLLPVRAVSEAMGLEVVWYGDEKMVSVGTEQMGVSFKIGENSYSKAKMAPFVLSCEPQLINELTYIPAEFFTDVLEAEMTVVEGKINFSL